MVQRTVTWTPKARRSKNEIFRYWNVRNGSIAYSEKLSRYFLEESEKLAANPFIGKRFSLRDLRYRVVRNYLIIYRITETSVEILEVWDGRRNPDDLKKIISKK